MGSQVLRSFGEWTLAYIPNLQSTLPLPLPLRLRPMRRVEVVVSTPGTARVNLSSCHMIAQSHRFIGLDRELQYIFHIGES